MARSATRSVSVIIVAAASIAIATGVCHDETPYSSLVEAVAHLPYLGTESRMPLDFVYRPLRLPSRDARVHDAHSLKVIAVAGELARKRGGEPAYVMCLALLCVGDVRSAA